MASVLTPLKSVNKQDWHLHNDSKIKVLLRTQGNIAG